MGQKPVDHRGGGGGKKENGGYPRLIRETPQSTSRQKQAAEQLAWKSSAAGNREAINQLFNIVVTIG